MVALNDLFRVRYGHSLELNRLSLSTNGDGIAFVSRKSGDNGVSAYVKAIAGIVPGKAGELTVALGGNGVLSTFLQEREFYTGRDVAILTPRMHMSKPKLLFYSMCIRANRYRYSYGRQANRSLKTLALPSLHEIPTWVDDANPEMYEGTDAPANKVQIPLKTPEEWRRFRYDEIFVIKKGYYNKKPPCHAKCASPSDVPFIGASEANNGVTAYVCLEDVKRYSRDGSIDTSEALERKLFPGNAITVPNNGASVAEAFYQAHQFTCTHDVNPLYLRDKSFILNNKVALFLTTIIRAEKYRWSYGRKWRPIRMPHSIIRLPVTSRGTPDWEYMEQFVSSLPFSSQL